MANATFRGCEIDPKHKQYRTFSYFNEFDRYTTATDGITTVSGSSGSIAVSTDTGKYVGGLIKLITAASSGDAEGVRTTNPIFLFQTGSAFDGECLMSYVNQATTTGAFAFGFTSNTAAELTSGGLLSTTSYSGCNIVKQKGDLVFSFQTSNSTTKQNYTSTTTATDGAYILRIDVQDWDANNVVCIPHVNGVQLRDSNQQPIYGVVSKTSAAAMYLKFDVMAGSSNVQNAWMDYLTYSGVRSPLGTLTF